MKILDALEKRIARQKMRNKLEQQEAHLSLDQKKKEELKKKHDERLIQDVLQLRRILQKDQR